VTTTRWWWVRHAPVTATGGRIYGQTDPPCDTDDSATFRVLASILPTQAILVTSNLQRTQQTANAIGVAGLALPRAIIEPAMAEQNFGKWQGRTHVEVTNELGARHAFWLMPAHSRPPGGETFAELMDRVREAILRLTHDNRGRDIVCVAHGGSIRAALGIALEVDPERALSFSVDNCSLTRIDHFEGRPFDEKPNNPNYYWAVVCANHRPELSTPGSVTTTPIA